MFPYVHEMNLAGWFHLGYFGVLLPLLCIHGRHKLIGAGQSLPNRLRYFRTTVFTLVMLSGVSLMVARVHWIWLFPHSLPSPGAVAAGVAMYAAALEFMRPRWRCAVERRAPVVHLFMPSTARERAWWLALSLVAGIGEEITWRGVQAALLCSLIGSFWLTAL